MKVGFDKEDDMSRYFKLCSFNAVVISLFIISKPCLSASYPASSTTHSLENSAPLANPGYIEREQIKIEQAILDTNNGLFISFAPEPDLALLISEQQQQPSGLIPPSQQTIYETLIKPRVIHLHQFPKHHINSFIFYYKKQLPAKVAGIKNVDLTFYQKFLTQYPEWIHEFPITQEIFNHYQAQGMPTAFYYYHGRDIEQYAAVFNHSLREENSSYLIENSVYYSREKYLAAVNLFLKNQGFPDVESLYQETVALQCIEQQT
jgi:hypothetical protein